MRPKFYNYFDELVEYLGGDTSRIFDGSLVYPRPLEIPLPGDGQRACNFSCAICQGRLLKQPLGKWEDKALRLIKKLQGRVPYHVYGGAYTEPILSPYLLDFITATKLYGSNFGIHTNGSLLLARESSERFLNTMIDIATSERDYISISLDAGSPESHQRFHNTESKWFDIIINGIRTATEIRDGRAWPSIRIVYLMNKHNCDKKEISEIVRIAKDLKVDSLRFSMPYDLYGKSFGSVRHYKQRFELAYSSEYYKTIRPWLTKSQRAKPSIFWIAPDCQDVDQMNYRQCIYSYFQITLAADCYVYRCSSTASPSFKFCRLGKITDNLRKFEKMIMANHDPEWDPGMCFSHGARCNRMALAVCKEYQEIKREVGK